MPLLPVVPYDPAILAATLTEHGVCQLSGLPDLLGTGALREELLLLVASGSMKSAEVGRGHGLMLRTEIRSDVTRWLDTTSGLAAMAHLALMESLRVELNRRLFLGLEVVEAHFANYPVGAFYARHRDRFRDSDTRRISMVTYLNPDWQPEQGGALRLYLPEGPADVYPQDGVTICFLSEIEHEVLPATRPRMSVAAWLRNRSH